jgi:hypothetical protein
MVLYYSIVVKLFTYAYLSAAAKGPKRPQAKKGLIKLRSPSLPRASSSVPGKDDPLAQFYFAKKGDDVVSFLKLHEKKILNKFKSGQ